MRTILKVILRVVTLPLLAVLPIINGNILILLFMLYFPINGVAWVITGAEWFPITYLPEMFVSGYERLCKKWQDALM